MPSTNYMKELMIDYDFGSTSYTPPSILYFGLSLSVLDATVNNEFIPTAMSYDGSKHVTLTFSNAINFVTMMPNDTLTVEGVDTAFSTANIDGEWLINSSTPTTVTFTTSVQPTGTTPQTLTGGLVTWAVTNEPNFIGNYARVGYDNDKVTWSIAGADTPSHGIITNAIDIVFPQSDLSWGVLKSIFIATNDTTYGGKILWYDELEPHIPMPAGNTTITFKANTIEITI